RAQARGGAGDQGGALPGAARARPRRGAPERRSGDRALEPPRPRAGRACCGHPVCVEHVRGQGGTLRLRAREARRGEARPGRPGALHADPDAEGDRPLPLPHPEHSPLAAAVPPGLERLQAGVGGRRAGVRLHGALRHRAARRGARGAAGRLSHPGGRGHARRGEGARPGGGGQGPVTGRAALPERPAGGEGQEGHLPAGALSRSNGGDVTEGFTVLVTGPTEADVESVALEIDGRLRARGVAVELIDSRTPDVLCLRAAGAATFVAGALARHGVVTVLALPAPSRAARDRARDMLGRLVEVYVRTEGGI